MGTHVLINSHNRFLTGLENLLFVSKGFKGVSNYIIRDSLVQRPIEEVKSYIYLFQMSIALENSLSVK